MITPANRQLYIADGQMYEIISNYAQQAAQSRMRTEFNLEWATLCDNSNGDDGNNGSPLRALVDEEHPLLLDEDENREVLRELLFLGGGEEKRDDDERRQQSSSLNKTKSLHNKTKSTLLIATGRGKVRAGIFSRQHLLTSGIEVGTSWHCIREARMRNWGVAVIDPNARGEGLGFDSFKRSVSKLFLDQMADAGDGNDGAGGGGENNATTGDSTQPPDATTSNNNAQQSSSSSKFMMHSQSCPALSSLSTTRSSRTQPSHSIYILAHSASGGQLVRHLREDAALLPSIRAIAFTDSTHNVQWCKSNPSLKEFLQMKNCVYLRTSDVRSTSSNSTRSMCIDEKGAGKVADTDQFWEHRFGGIRTLWAGTAEHSLSNYAGHESIWDHFDEHASSEEEEDGGCNGNKEEEDCGDDDGTEEGEEYCVPLKW